MTNATSAIAAIATVRRDTARRDTARRDTARRDTARRDTARRDVVPAASAPSSARTSSPALPNRSAGVLASARSSTSCTAAPTVRRVTRTSGTGACTCFASTACVDAPWYGGSPASIS